MPGRVLLRPAHLAPVVLGLAVALTAAGCASTATGSGGSTAKTTVTEAPGDAPVSAGSGSSSGDSGTGTGTGSTGGGSTGGGSTGGGSTGGGSTGGGSGSSGGGSGTKSSGPTIGYFRVAQKPTCPAGTNVNPIAGTPVVVEWKTGNVDSVALSVDGPGVYGDNYPPAGSETLNFPCSGGEGDVQEHTYTLTVRNAHGKQSKTIVVTAKVHDIPRV
ncbi:hypothetical protein GA0070558_11983 [Micromonospora haikouensis]|uniref:Ig-like domain-containing protein n=1 Tax=Micromonospora haikouensis TaxID=686309 RepID=A0A1C4WX56_9ACTN|nr:hypothetical protein [Micromonospora haikouensis]SCF00847.1 hypothetical protein GA0070558_11983 [Micromonospora haikouensis]